MTRALAQAGAGEVAVVGRTPDRVAATVALAGDVGRAAEESAVADALLVVNATPVGMGEDDALPFDPARLHPEQVVIDLVYHPLETALVRTCRTRGVQVANGVGMLVHQAGHQFRSWTGLDPPLTVVQAAVDATLGGRR